MGLNDVFLLNTDIRTNNRALEDPLFEKNTSGEAVRYAFYTNKIKGQLPAGPFFSPFACNR